MQLSYPSRLDIMSNRMKGEDVRDKVYRVNSPSKRIFSFLSHRSIDHPWDRRKEKVMEGEESSLFLSEGAGRKFSLFSVAQAPS